MSVIPLIFDNSLSLLGSCNGPEHVKHECRMVIDKQMNRITRCYYNYSAKPDLNKQVIFDALTRYLQTKSQKNCVSLLENRSSFCKIMEPFAKI